MGRATSFGSGFRGGWLQVAGATLGGLLLWVPPQVGAAEPPVVPLPRAHAHNDYEHPRPLLDALAHGFCSVEADIYLVEGALLVAHDRQDVKAERTLERLYLDPLQARVRSHGGGVYPNGPPFLLLVDIKSEAEPTYGVLRERLRPYAPILTRFAADRIETNAVTVVISGNRPAEERLAMEVERWVALDGRLPDLERNPPRSLYPLVSDHWGRHFQWRGEGELVGEDRAKLAGLVEQAHAQGRWLRFWALPGGEAAWGVVHQAGVDLINADDLAGLQSFFSRAPQSGPARSVSPPDR